MNFKTALCFAIFSSILLLAMAQSRQEVPGETLARMQKLGEELATPNLNHAFLSQMAGEWITSSSVMGTKPSAGTASYNMILGNLFLDGSHDGSFMSIPFEGRLAIGYDNYKHKFVATFFDNLGTSMRSAEGILDKTGKTLTLWGTMDEWMTDEHDKPVMYKYIMIDESHFNFEVHDLALGDSSKVITVTYKRIQE